MSSAAEKMIDRWFPIAAVDEACRNRIGSGKVEKAIFPWFASRPIAQARAAALTSLLPYDPALKPIIEAAVRHGEKTAVDSLSAQIAISRDGEPPIVLDMFSGRGIIPLEAARAGAFAIGIDLSPVATLGGRILADYIARDWSLEPEIPYRNVQNNTLPLDKFDNDRLVSDVALVLREIGRRVSADMEERYPRNERGEFPWAYLWAIEMPCDGCKRRFPLIGSFVLRYPYKKADDPGQSIRLLLDGDSWEVEPVDGLPKQTPTYSSGLKADGKKKKGKMARCPFCNFVHSLETVKSKGQAGEYRDRLLLVADTDVNGKKYFRSPSSFEVDAAYRKPSFTEDQNSPYSVIPNESIPAGNVHTLMASGYGFRAFGDLMCARQTMSFACTARAIRDVARDLNHHGVSREYIQLLSDYAASVLCRRLRRATRGVGIQWFGDASGDKNNNLAVNNVFSNESKINFQFDWLEAGPGDGPATWTSVSDNAIQSLAKVRLERFGTPAKILCASATSLPLRDASVDVVITDPPYYDMIEYADASDLFYVWLKRILFQIEPDLFGVGAQESDGLQNKNEEIIVRRVHEPARVRHDTAFYEEMLAKSFREARRVLKRDGHMVVMFGHSDPDAWRRLLGALQTAGFIVTSAWPSRTESANTGVASIKVTVTIGCRVAATDRPVGISAEVDREVIEAVSDRVVQWDLDGLALEDQLMASYGPAMEVYGRYSRVINPDGSDADLDHYLALARRAVRDAMRLRVDELPLETFDSVTRFAMFWLRAKNRSIVPKGEARFFAQADELHLDDLRERILTETAAGFQIRLHDSALITPRSSLFEVVRGMAHAWEVGGMEAVAATIAAAEMEANNQHLWAVVSDLANHLPASDKTAKALAGIKRSSNTISTLVSGARDNSRQGDLFDTVED
jgi:adenine-specific DNA methylase